MEFLIGNCLEAKEKTKNKHTRNLYREGKKGVLLTTVLNIAEEIIVGSSPRTGSSTLSGMSAETNV